MSTGMTAADLAMRLALKRYPRSWRGRCPCCDYPGAVFSVREVKGRTSVYCANGCSRDDLNDALFGIFRDGWHPPQPDDEQDDDARRARKQAAALRLWAGSDPAAGTLADKYLTARGLPGLASSPALRFRSDCRHPEERSKYPALVALVTDVVGRPIAVHRTFLARDGSRKANTEPQKASLGPIWGGGIRLYPVASPELVVGEGIETSASAGRLLCMPAWSAVAAGNLARSLVLPPEVRRVVIAADPDEEGRKAARAAWFRWRGEGREVRIAIPDREGADFNDVLRRPPHFDGRAT
jgi:putative DNA primase/helicase